MTSDSSMSLETSSMSSLMTHLPEPMHFSHPVQNPIRFSATRTFRTSLPASFAPSANLSQRRSVFPFLRGEDDSMSTLEHMGCESGSSA